MKLQGATAVVASAVLLASAGSAVARSVSHPTTITEEGAYVVGSDLFHYGVVTSPQQRCIRNRTVKIIARYPNGTSKVIDTDRTSTNGAWAAGGDFSGIDPPAKARVTRKSFRRHGRRHVCQRDSTNLGG